MTSARLLSPNEIGVGCVDDALVVARLQLLLGILADAECERLGIVSTTAQVQEITRWYRSRYNLLWRHELDEFLESVELTELMFMRQMLTFANITGVQRHHRALVERRMPDMEALLSARDWVLRREDLLRGGEPT